MIRQRQVAQLLQWHVLQRPELVCLTHLASEPLLICSFKSCTHANQPIIELVNLDIECAYVYRKEGGGGEREMDCYAR